MTNTPDTLREIDLVQQSPQKETVGHALSSDTKSGEADFARRCEAYLEDAPLDGRHSDAAGANAYELIAEAIEWLKPPAPPINGDVACSCSWGCVERTDGTCRRAAALSNSEGGAA